MPNVRYWLDEGFSLEEAIRRDTTPIALSLLELTTYPGFEWLMERYVDEIAPPHPGQQQEGKAKP